MNLGDLDGKDLKRKHSSWGCRSFLEKNNNKTIGKIVMIVQGFDEI